MSRSLAVLAALSLLLAPAVHAREDAGSTQAAAPPTPPPTTTPATPATPATPPPPRDWSLGAGVSLVGLGLQPGGFGLRPLPAAPVVEGGLERRLGERLWLVTFLGATVSSARAPSALPAPPLSEADGASTFSGGARVGLGLRTWLTPADAPVVLSVAGAVAFEYSRSLSRSALVRGDGGVQSFASSAWTGVAGVSGSVAGEHFLTPQLALRVRVQVLDLGVFMSRGSTLYLPSFGGGLGGLGGSTLPATSQVGASQVGASQVGASQVGGGEQAPRPPPVTGVTGGLTFNPAVDLRLFF
jgi:hypothetical protein